uniref:Uncharacterized protein n=1 Tax=Medicago truncatula TaxID=3880 RepID=I3S0H8_MEDTR|nr:unknown [Medicago truncatula]
MHTPKPNLHQSHFILIINANTTIYHASLKILPFHSKLHPRLSSPHSLPLTHPSQRKMLYFKPKHPFQQP